MPFYQVPRTVLHQEVVRLLLQQIKEEIWLPGEQLPSETEFAERFGVSRNCIREALKALSFSGIVCSRPGQGTFLTKDAYLRIANYDLIGTIANCSSISDLMETRIIIESQLAGLAAKRATDEDIQLISSALEELKADLLAQINSGTKTNPTRSGMKFHTAIINAAKNKLLSEFLYSIRGELEAQRSQLSLYQSNIIEMIDDHVRIYQAIVNNDSVGAAQAMMNHLKHTYKTINENKDV